ncbi:hypothetical protein Pr1d_41910 [Bythopirellula goksoeyrii]|uniref:Uncharacterized protein n=1 Tax=Bythopirellula goksoeyrii TaxID=1400387 RepID=A0A5B9QD87_9BACT|nr:hypothetical protein Pr1d_41910 [Bythopirellula goksoeyrii]
MVEDECHKKHKKAQKPRDLIGLSNTFLFVCFVFLVAVRSLIAPVVNHKLGGLSSLGIKLYHFTEFCGNN